MTDPRIELLEGAADTDAAPLVDAIDSMRLVVEAPPQRQVSRADQAALFNLVNLLGRLFPHLDVRLGEPECRLAPLATGALGPALSSMASMISPSATRAPERDFHLAWGHPPSGPGLAMDAAGWSLTVGETHRPLAAGSEDGVLAALAATCWGAAQAYVRVLAPLGAPGHVSSGFAWNLLDYTCGLVPSTLATPETFDPFTLLGCGSVGSSVLYCTLLAGMTGEADLVDDDSFKARNHLRYPVLTVPTTDRKTQWLTDLARSGGIDAQSHPTDVAGYLSSFPEPRAIRIVLSSVDTLTGRRDATDALAATTLSAGVAGLKLHISRHHFGDGESCPYCQYVDVAPALSGTEALAAQIGLPHDRVIAIEELESGRISAADAELLAASGHYAHPPPAAGDRLADLQRRIYAQAVIPVGEQQVAVSAPFVSAMAGLLLLTEAAKLSSPDLAPHRVDRRLGLDMSGEPAGFQERPHRDNSGRCLCASAFRRRAAAALHQDRALL